MVLLLDFEDFYRVGQDMDDPDYQDLGFKKTSSCGNKAGKILLLSQGCIAAGAYCFWRTAGLPVHGIGYHGKKEAVYFGEGSVGIKCALPGASRPHLHPDHCCHWLSPGRPTACLPIPFCLGAARYHLDDIS